MIDPTEHEIGAMLSASDCAGQYLDSIGVQFPAMTEEQWMTLIETTITGYQDTLASLKAVPTETKCSVCGEAQFETTSGITCQNGHGGAPAA